MKALLKIGLYGVGLLMIFNTPGISGDIYLLKITSENELKIAETVIDHACGKIDGKFIVDLSAEQARTLSLAGITPELIEPNADIKNYYILYKAIPAVQKTALYFDAQYSHDNEFLVNMEKSSTEIVMKSGYQVIPLEGLKIPLYYRQLTFPAASLPAYPSDTVADLVSRDSVYTYDTRLENFQTRYIYTDSIHSARDWLVEKFTSFGYTNVFTELFYYGSLPCYNVVCIKPGSAEPDKLIVVGGHYDSINFQNDGSGMTFAPGADDNASGTVVALELARIFRNVDTRKSIMFVAFSAEEVGLYGAYHRAQQLYNDTDYDVEVMFNFDMVAYNEDMNNMVNVNYMDDISYAAAMYDAVNRVTYLSPNFNSGGGSSDHRAFDAYGFMIAYASEGIFNTPGWHTNIDISSRLDFEYLEQVTRAAAATVGHVDRAASPTPVEKLLDAGDGQAIRVIWGNCNSEYSYKVAYGTSAQNYTDTVDMLSAVPPCYFDIDGLTAGQTYYVTVIGYNGEGYGPLVLSEKSISPQILPRIPSTVTADPDLNQIRLSWVANPELDFSHYVISRRPTGGVWQVLDDNFTDTAYMDITANPHTEYEYAIKAVDIDQNESGLSAIVKAFSATFDWSLLYVDETSGTGGINPSETKQAQFYDSLLFNDVQFGKYRTDQAGSVLSRSTAGQYGAVFWIDDDLNTHSLSVSSYALEWYLGYETNFCLSGWQTVTWLTGSGILPENHFMRRQFNLYQVTDNTAFDFIGAFGQNGWPNLQTTTNNIFSGNLPNIPIFEVLPGAEVIYTYNSLTNNPQFENEPCAVLYNTGQGKHLVFAFPFIQLTNESALALMEKIFETLGIEKTALWGDANNNGLINLLDITFIINYLYRAGPTPPVINLADVDSDCSITLLDITWLINHLYKNGSEPLPGCVE